MNFESHIDDQKAEEEEKMQEQKETFNRHINIANTAAKTMKKKLKMVSKQHK